jgi:hypothetical protein
MWGKTDEVSGTEAYVTSDETLRLILKGYYASLIANRKSFPDILKETLATAIISSLRMMKILIC